MTLKVQKNISQKTKLSKEGEEIFSYLSENVLPKFKELAPKLNDITLHDILDTPDLLDVCIKIFKKNKSHFESVLIPKNPEDSLNEKIALAPCGLSELRVITLLLRTSARRYFIKHLTPKEKKENPKVFSLKKLFQKQEPQKNVSPGKKQYALLKDKLHYDWQIPLIPKYSQMTPGILEALGASFFSLKTEAEIDAFLSLGHTNLNQAKSIVGEDLAKEMMHIAPTAAIGVAHVGQKEFDRLSTSLLNRMQKAQFWKIFTKKDILNALGQTNTKELIEMSEHLHIIDSTTVDLLIKHIPAQKIGIFLKVGYEILGDSLFEKTFGENGESQTTLTLLKKAKDIKHDHTKLHEFEEQMKSIFEAYKGNQKNFKKISF